MKRRDFITVLGGAAATWPLAAGAQQPMPVIGFLNGGSADGYAHARDGFLQGLKEADYIVDQNVAIEYRWAEGEYDRLPALAADLLRRQVAVLVVNNAATPAAKAATAKIPIVFASGGDPVRSGLVTSLNRPSSNVTGVYFLIDALATKNLHLLHQLVPTAKVMGVLKNPNNPNMESETSGLEAAASSFGCQLQVVNASSERDINTAFANLAQMRAGALIVASDSFFFARRQQLVALTARHSIPTVYPWREAVAAGGLIGYGTSISDAYRQVGIYTGRILKGAKPADLPVEQSTKFELVINLRTAKALGLTIPDKSARACRRGD